MATWWNSQQGEGQFSLQFETDDKEKYKLVEKAAQMAVDGKTVADFAEVKHGEWALKYRGVGHYWECSECKYANCVLPPTNFCPNCGAKMEGDCDDL